MSGLSAPLTIEVEYVGVDLGGQPGLCSSLVACHPEPLSARRGEVGQDALLVDRRELAFIEDDPPRDHDGLQIRARCPVQQDIQDGDRGVLRAGPQQPLLVHDEKVRLLALRERAQGRFLPDGLGTGGGRATQHLERIEAADFQLGGDPLQVGGET